MSNDVLRGTVKILDNGDLRILLGKIHKRDTLYWLETNTECIALADAEVTRHAAINGEEFYVCSNPVVLTNN